MSRIRVLHLISGFLIEKIAGGVTRYVVELARCLQGDDIALRVGGLWEYGTQYEEPRRADLIARGIPAVVAAEWNEKSAYWSCIEAWMKFPVAQVGPVDIVHSHGEFSDLLAILLRRRLKAKYLVRTIHNEIEWAKRPLYGKLFPNLIYPFFFDSELGVSRRVVENADRRIFGRLLGHRAQVMHNALNFERFDGHPVDRKNKLAELGISADALVIGTVGRLVPQKAIDVLIQTAPLVLQKFPQAVYLITGDGPLRSNLEAQSLQLGISGSLYFTGTRNDVEEIFGTMDLFVSSSRWEGLPTAILESMAARVPVVATRVSGTTELVKDEETGLLVSPGDVSELATAIIRLLQDRQLAAQLARKAENHARSHFSMDEVARQHVAFYRNLIQPKPFGTNP